MHLSTSAVSSKNITECQDERAPVCSVDTCRNGGSCRLLGADAFQCHCPLGFTGTHCERRTLTHIVSLFRELANTCSGTCCLSSVFTRESSYCFQRVLAIAILSVCLPVCPSHGWISQKRCKLGSPNFRRRLPGRLWFQEP